MLRNIFYVHLLIVANEVLWQRNVYDRELRSWYKALHSYQIASFLPHPFLPRQPLNASTPAQTNCTSSPAHFEREACKGPIVFYVQGEAGGFLKRYSVCKLNAQNIFR